MADNADWTRELQEAMELLEKGQIKPCLVALHAMLQDSGNDEFRKAIIFDGMGRALFADNQPELGMEAFTESLNILRRLFDGKTLSADFIQGALQNQAHAFLIIGDYGKAENLGREALQLAEKNWGPESFQTAQALFHLAAPYYERKDYDQAEKLLLRAKDIWENLPGPPPEQIGTVLNNLGRIYEERNELEHGIAYHRRAVAFRRQQPDKHDLAFSLGNFGVALGSNGQLEEACEALREAVVIYSALGLGESPEAKAYAANLELFEKALNNSSGE